MDLPGGLGTDIDVAAWLQGAEGSHAAFYVTAVDRDGGETVAPRRQDLPGGEGDDRDQAERDKQGASGASRTFHAGFQPMEDRSVITPAGCFRLLAGTREISVRREAPV